MTILSGSARSNGSPQRGTEARRGGRTYRILKGATYEMNIEGTSVLYQAEPYAWPLGRKWKAIAKSEKEVTAFIERLKTLGVFEWEEEYGWEALDGVSWRFELSGERQAVRANGFNDFPPRFAEVQRAVQDFVGGRSRFRSDIVLPTRSCPMCRRSGRAER